MDFPITDSTKSPIGLILWEGLSPYNGERIACIITGYESDSDNTKTGTMLQSWILPVDMAPHVAIKCGYDACVCGHCPHRQHNGGDCYVVVHQAPLAVWDAYRRGRYTRDVAAFLDATRGRMLRMGAWGDPGMVPFEAWEPLLAVCGGHTGYTHQWKVCDLRYRDFVMASTEPDTDAEAKAEGWRTFCTLPHGSATTGRAICPASINKAVTCSRCAACDGNSTGRKSHIAIIAHGSRAKRAAKLAA